jgi:ABC-type multidrug transport system fused ATPase/permease subunit
MEALGAPALAPSRVVEIVDRTFRIYRNHFLAFAGLVAVVILPLSLLATSISSNPVTYEEGESWQEYRDAVQAQAQTVLAINLLEQFLLAVVVSATITVIVSESVLGRTIPITKAFGQVKGRLLPLIGALILVFIVFVILFVALLLLTAVCGISIALGALLLYYGLALYFFTVPVMVLERTGAGLGVSRAQYLGRERFWPTLGFLFVIWVVMGIIQLAFGSAGWLIGDTSLEGASALRTAISLAVTIFVTPILPIGLTLMYYDARIRIEGLDFALQAVNSPEPRPSDVESPEPATRLITLRDLINTLMLIIAGAAVLCGFYTLAYALFSVAA